MKKDKENQIKEKNVEKKKNKKGKLKKHININVNFTIVAIILIAIFCVCVTPVTFQNDTYYTIKIGELIKNNGIDMMDHFSWHENLSYTYPHWLYDFCTYLIYSIGGFKGVYIITCVLSAILGISIFLVNSKLTKSKSISFIITMGVIYALKPYIAARAQLVTFILFIWELFFIEKFIENRKIGYGIGLILISTLIANLHVAAWPFLFIISLPYIAEYIICLIADTIIYEKLSILHKKHLIKKYKNDEEKKQKVIDELNKIELQNGKIKDVREKQEPYKLKMKLNKNVKWLILIMIICWLTGFLTPLGTTPYTYLVKTMSGNTMNNINEHLPLTLANNIPIMCTLIIILSLLIFTKSKIRVADLFMLGGLTYLMFSSRRHATWIAIIGSIILNRIIMDTIEVYNKEKFEILLKQIVGGVGALVACLAIYYGATFIEKKKNNSYVSESSYPVQAADWILENLDVKNIKIISNIDEAATINADYNWQLEAITNIIKNAVEHSSDNSNIYINVENTSVFVKIQIKDEGEGISKKDINHIFERFYKSKNSSENSIGIGLSLAKTIIEKANGYIKVESEEEKGTMFEIKYLK